MPSIPCSCPWATCVLAAALSVAAMRTHADCIDDAAARHRVNAVVLRAIGWQESRLQPGAIAHNANGSTDLGAFQINSIHLPTLAHYGIDRAALIDGCVSAEVAAWHYRRQIDLLGNTWQAIGAYHSRTDARAGAYANRIASVLMRWQAMPAGPLPFAERPRRRPTQEPEQPVAAKAAAEAPMAEARRFDVIAFVPTAR